MSIDAAIYAALSPLAPTYPLTSPQGAAEPRITYQRISGRAFETLADGGVSRLRVQIDIWASGFAQAQDLVLQAKDALRAALTVGEITDNPDAFEPDTRLYRASFDVAVWP